MALRKSQIIPPTADVGGIVCFRVTCPDSPLWRSAVKSAILSLSKGRYWDGRSGAIVDAQEISRAIYDSIELDDCGDCGGVSDTILGELQTLKQEIKDMQVIVNNYGGGCGCGESGVVSSGSTSGQEWDSPFDLCLDPIPDGVNQEDDGFEDWKCASSNHVVLRLKALVVAIRQLISIGETGYTAFVEQVNNQFNGSFVVNVSTALFASMLTFVTGILSFEVMNTITDWIDSEYENLVNAINCADSPASAYATVLSVINGSSLSTPLKYALRYLFLLIPYASVFLPESERSDIPAYDYQCNCGETVYDFDVTVNLMTGEPNVEFLSFFPEARVKLKEWWASMNATDALPNGELGFSRTGLKQIVDAVAGSPVTSATLQLFEWVGEGAIEGVGDWGIGSGATCADGYDHSVTGDNSGIVQSGIILTCPQSLFSHIMNEDIVNGDGQASIVSIQQNYLNTVATGLSEGHVLSMRFAGSFVV